MSLLDALWEYQQADARVDRIEQEVQSTDEYKRYAQLHKFIAKQRRVVTKMGKTVSLREEQVEKAKQTIEMLNRRYQDGLSKFERANKDSVAEVERFRKYFEQLNTRITQQKTELNEVVKSLEKEEVAIQDIRVKLVQANKEYTEAQNAVSEITASYKTEMDKVKKEIKACAKTVDPDLLARYKQIKKSHTPVVAMVIDERCGGCNMLQPAVTLRKLRDGKEIVECDNCGRLLRLE